MTELSPESRDLLRAAGGGDDPGPDDHARVRAALVGKLAIGGSAAAAATSAKTASAATLGAAKTGLALKLGVALALVAGGGGAVYLATRDPSTTTPVAAPAVPAVAPDPVPVAPPPAIEPEPEPEPAAPASDRKRAPRPSPTAPVADPPAEAAALALQRETAALRASREALRDRNPARALAALDDYTKQFPRGVLAEEADALRIDALCARGSVDEARAAAARFVAEHPRSIHASRVARGCEGDGP